MRVTGTVRVWHGDQGWGVIDSPVTPRGCWAHFSAVRMAGHEQLAASTEVRFTFEAVRQDGYAFRAVEVLPPGVDETAEPDLPASGPSDGYSSTLTLNFKKAKDVEGDRPPG